MSFDTGAMRVTLSRRMDYAVRAMLALAAEEGSQLVSARSISARMGIPAHFLPHVLTDLARANLVVASPGRRGGYSLARSASSISVLDVIDAVEPDTGARCVLRGGPCRPDGRCAVHDVIAGATSAMRTALAGHNLAEIVAVGGLATLLSR